MIFRGVFLENRVCSLDSAALSCSSLIFLAHLYDSQPLLGATLKQTLSEYTIMSRTSGYLSGAESVETRPSTCVNALRT